MSANPFVRITRRRSRSAGSGVDLDSLREENRGLRRAVEELSVLNELARTIGALTDTDAIVRHIVERSMNAVEAEQAVVTLVDPGETAAAKTLVRAMVSSSRHPRIHLNESLLGWMLLNRSPFVSNDPRHDERLRGIDPGDVRSIACVPLMVKSTLIGVLSAYNRKGGFRDEDVRLLGIIAGQSAQVIENARLYEEERKLVGMREQVKLAADIQRQLLPATSPEPPGYEVAALTRPAQDVGGDYYDFISLDTGCVGICVADVTGKGLPAALLMANLQATLRATASLVHDVAGIVTRASAMLHASTGPEKFATCFYGCLRPERHEFEFCSAGHERPVLLRGDSVERLESAGLPLGVMEEFPYSATTIPLEPGDVLVVYSDGVTDAVDANDREFGEERLVDVIRAGRADGARALCQRVVDAVEAHARGREPFDDVTVAVIRRTGIR